MYLLEKMHLVQFYLFSAQTLHFGSSSAIVAPNGSGKSSVLDAMQTVLHGGNERQIDLNAQSGGGRKGGRTIREYCLGYFSDKEHARDHATTYLTLVFRDSTGKHPVVSAGIALGASVDEPTHRIYGSYIAPGVDLALEDHLEAKGDAIPLDWAAFTALLKDKGEQAGIASVFPDKRVKHEFVEHLLFRLRPASARSIDHVAFSKALKNALNLKDVDDASAFVRERIVEARPIHVRDFRNQLDSFRQLRVRVQEVKERIEKTQETLEVSKKAIGTRMRKASYAAMAAEFRRELHMEQLDAAEEASTVADEAYQTAQANAVKAKTFFEHANTRLIELTTQAKNDPNFNRRHDLLVERDKALGPIKVNLARELRRIVGAYQQGADHDPGIGGWNFLAQSWRHLLSAVEATAAGDRLEISEENEAASLRSTLEKTQQLLATVTQRSQVDARAHEEAKRAFKLAADNLHRAQTGKATLPENVNHVRRFLEDAGITATPVCDLVTVADPQWGPAIEAYLSRNVAALLVEASKENEAIRIYESIPDRYNPFGVKIVQPPRKPAEFSDLPERALARLIEGEDARAVTFVRGQLRRLLQLDTATKDSPDGLTIRGTLVNNGVVERRRLPAVSDVLLGAQDRRAQTDFHAREKQRLSVALNEAERAAERSRQLVNKTAALAQLPNTLETLDRWLQDHAQAARDLEAQTRMAELADNPDLLALQELIAAANTAYATALEAKSQADKAEGAAKSEAEHARQAFDTLQEGVESMGKAAVAAMGHRHVDMGWLDAKRSELETDDVPFAALIAKCEGRVRSLSDAYAKEEAAVRSSLIQYIALYRDDSGVNPSDVDAVNVFLSRELIRLQESELARYEREAEDAYGTAVRTFRSRIAASLNASFDDMATQMRNLNSLLGKMPPFTNDERYHFKWQVAPDHKPLYTFIRNVAELAGGEEDIFSDPVKTPEQFRALLEDTDSQSQALLEDYRRFFTFEVEVMRNGKQISTLGSRMEKGSGGEHRAPLFVVAGAALAAAYGKMQGDKEGLSLILFDELGDKIDGNNTRAVFEYLKSLGLQPIVAAPDDALGKINESIDGYVELYRDGDYLSVQHVGLGPEAKRILSLDDLSLHPEQLEEEMRRVEQERGVIV